MALRTVQPPLKTADLSIARLPPKTADPRYRTTDWKALRQQILERDNYQCEAPGCRVRAIVVDHIRSPRNGGSDDPSNLRSVCRTHDNRARSCPTAPAATAAGSTRPSRTGAR
jgi:5-methylcytosine-specific restriction endonuclease McrA